MGIKYVGDQISNFFSDITQKQEDKREQDLETEAETTKDLKEILREEQEQLDKILGQDK